MICGNHNTPNVTVGGITHCPECEGKPRLDEELLARALEWASENIEDVTGLPGAGDFLSAALDLWIDHQHPADP
jgi:hypothetical protein